MIYLYIGFVEQKINLVVKYNYTGYGITTVSGSLATTLGKDNPFRFKGYYFDEESSMYYCQSRYYVPEWGRWLNADISNLSNINVLNLYRYVNNNPVSFAYGSYDVIRSATNEMVNIARTSFGDFAQSKDSLSFNYLDLNKLGNIFTFSQNHFAAIAGFFEGTRRYLELGKIESIAKTSKVLTHVGFWLNVGLSAYNNFLDDKLSKQEKWVSFGVDVVYITGTTIGLYYLAMVPYVGPYLAIIGGTGIGYLWSGKLNVFGFDVDVPVFKVNGKTIEEWVKEWINSWFK